MADSPECTSTRIAERIADLAQSRRRSVAVVESLTGGLISSALARAPSASTWFRGGIVAYSHVVKHQLLGVPEGPVVSANAVRVMARWAREHMGADVTVAVSGAGGPEPQDGQPPGTVYFARGAADGAVDVEHHLFETADPAETCARASAHALHLILDGLTSAAPG